MCGIVGYIGNKEAYPIIINGLKRLEYRGYDSAGFVVNAGKFISEKTKGKVSDLEEKSAKDTLSGATFGIGHTRWATHGVPNDVNSHPHFSNSGKLVIVHNGIIENYQPIKQRLLKEGYVFHSDTDTEVLVNFIEYIKNKKQLPLEEAVRYALNEVVGAYAIAVMEEDHPSKMVVARLGSPLVIGIGENEFYIASDASPFIEYTQNALYLEDGEMATIELNQEVQVRKIHNNEEVDPTIQELKLSIDAIEKGGYEHFMLKEIFEQPQSIQDTMRGRLLEDHTTKISGINNNLKQFLSADRIVIVACGTSWHAGLVGEYLFEELARIPVEVEYASEFRYRNPVINPSDVVIAISQSGETADTLAALKLAKERGAFIYGICNVVGSSIARLTHSGTYTHAGPEIGVASTKAFTTQLTVLTLLALHLGHKKGTIDHTTYKKLCQNLALMPDLVAKTIEMTKDKVIEIAQEYKDVSNCIYLGRGYNFPVALEGALKLKEISYIHAEGYPAAEMKHGPIALIDENMPVIFLAPSKGHYEKVVSNAQEIKARKGKIIAVVTENDTQMSSLADHTLEIPEVDEIFSPILSVIPLQLLSYHIATMRGCNVDQPRNLAKSVTVE
ncbi:glutamine--fructose-6-phosphate transaminase (isomerizing) [Capnocytophaga gingivalis]|jgi:glutamine-fructose-6-phosphate transaminase (isomerizing)|uniref:Glutamine--fructose-6-phosphate aminotransferase [isomerizing] n=1 Tax=Capnocytophaga gingivalis TaxID=1017 RepID=A0ABU5Y7F0_9FLAO|nr:glutamine--fructose-6-phosphate transaminase (isomerizing) [Capnocytophaga gingivalis]MEB3039859.1 glutamine--fructose-6-phosphate transaminase (isomerizing) [Capnocytophaga gingivalis]RKW05086.1 MAG: glutamine--fructose-6-phosphate transaminase (isomerizing) [Capnocytophaga sp.]RKW16771.1 MAG: glutamine--fructose-6-phosphate transaminase (isomerizing) [Capnocytophaga sp.]